MGRKQTKHRKRLLFYFACCLLAFLTLNGCSSVGEYHKKARIYQHLDRAKELAGSGYWWQAISEQEKALKLSPDRPPGDRILYEMGLLLIDSRNRDRDYDKSLKIFHQLLREFPQSGYRKEAETWAFVLAALIQVQERLKKSETNAKELQNRILHKEKLIETLKDQRKKMKQIDLELNKKREPTVPEEE